MRPTLSQIPLETNSGCKYTRTQLMQIGYARWKGRRFYNIYCLDEFDRKEFPWAQFRIEISSGVFQTNPLFTSVPAAVKTFKNGKACKASMIWQTSDDLPIESVPIEIIERYSNWKIWVDEIPQ